MFCSKCGKEIDDASNFCPSCGHNFNNVSSNNGSEATEKINNATEKLSKSVDKLSNKFTSKFNNQKKVVVSDSNFDYSNSNLKPLTFSTNIDTTHVKRNHYKHPYIKLGGFLAFIYYGGLIGEIIACISMLIAIFGLFAMLPYAPQYFILILLMVPFSIIGIILAFRFLIKIKHKDVDFLHFYHKTMIIVVLFLYIPEQIIAFIVMLTANTTGISSQYASMVIGPMIGGFIGGLITNLLFIVLFAVLLTVYFVKSVRVRTYIGTDMYAKLSVFTRNMKVADPAVPDNSYQQASNVSDNQVNQTSVENNENATQQNNTETKEENKTDNTFCSNCGNKIIDNNRFCTKCGHKVK